MPVFKSPSSTVRSVDLNTAKTEPLGIPGIFVGSSRRGPAFVPISMGDFSSFITSFGNLDAKRFGPIALERWLNGAASAATYIRLLGAGDCKRRVRTGPNAGKVNRAGYVVGEEQVQENGFLGPNIYAANGGSAGRSYVLGCFMSESIGSTYFSEAGLQEPGSESSIPIIRGILYAASGVQISLNSEAAENNTPSLTASGEYSLTGDGGLSFGDVLVADGQEANFIVLLNGHTSTELYPNSITASFYPNINPPEGVKSIQYAFNTDPEKLEQAGHYLKKYYDISENYAVCTGSGITDHVDTTTTHVKTDGENYKLYQTAFLLTSSLDRNTGTNTDYSSNFIGIPNFESYEDRFSTAFSPNVISQKIDGDYKNLFSLHCLDDGVAGFANYKVTISNINPKPIEASTNYGKFDLHIRSLSQNDNEFAQAGIDGSPNAGSLESYYGLDLDPSSNDFIAKRIGDRHVFYDFDKTREESKKIVHDGLYPNVSNIVRVSVSKEVLEGTLSPSALPFGFRGLYHMQTSGSSESGPILTGSTDALPGSEGSLSTRSQITSEILKSINQPPAPFREALFTLNENDIPVINYVPTWGYQVEEKALPEDPNKLGTFASSSISYLAYLPSFHTLHQNLWVGNNEGAKSVGGAILDADKFNNNFFSLDKIEIIPNALTKLPDPDLWYASRYRRDGRAKEQLKKIVNLVTGEFVYASSRMIEPSDLNDASSRLKLSFTFPIQGGFDGTNLFNSDSLLFTNNAIIREAQDPNQGGRHGPTISAHNRVIEILEDNDSYTGNVLFTPGVREDIVSGEYLDLCQRRFDMFYVRDLEERGHLNQKMTGSEMGPFSTLEEEKNSVTDAVKNIRETLVQSFPNTTFGAAYYPDVLTTVDVEEEADAIPVQVPPSVAVAHVYSNLGEEFSKPIGTTRGALRPGDVETIKLTDNEIDDYYQAGINVIAKDPQIPTAGSFIRSQKTLGPVADTASKVSIRRMLIMVRRIIKNTLRQKYLFEKLTPQTLYRMKSLIEEELAVLKSRGAFKSYGVLLDDSTTSSNDASNGIVRGKVKIVPNDASETFYIDIEETAEDE